MANAKQTDSLTPELKLPNPFEPVSISLDGDETDTFARFVVKPLERGFGITVGNALRRVLLSALPGASVVAVQIEGAPHEFTALKGIKPDVTGIILNLKDLVLKIDENTTELKRIEVDAKGPKVLTAGDLPLPSMVEVINPDLEIATINEGAELHMTIFVGNGRGYVTSEQNKSERRIDTVGVIATDSNYSPIEKVAFHVEPTRVLHDSDFDCLTLEVTTNGSVKPHEAVAMRPAARRPLLAVRHPRGEGEGLQDHQGRDQARGEQIPGDAHRGTRSERPQQQLPQEGRNLHRHGTHSEERGRDDEGPQPRQEVA